MRAWLRYRDSDGKLLDVLNAPPADRPGHTVIEDDWSGDRMWDEATRSLVPRPAPRRIDRLRELAEDATLADVWSRLTPVQRQKLRSAIQRVFGDWLTDG